MVKVWIDYSDGVFSFREAPDNEPTKGCNVFVIEDSMWRAYQAFKDQCRLWNHIIGDLDDHNHLE